MKNETLQPKYRKDYLAPEYVINEVKLEFKLDPDKTYVKSIMQVERKGSEFTDLVLDGEQISLTKVMINGEQFSDYVQTDNHLILSAQSLKEFEPTFELTIENHINPSLNTALEGLYQSGEALCTQCEAEGFRRITYYLDRPDVLAKFTTRIEANKTQYPYLLSNGNLIEAGKVDDITHFVVWEDPFLKPAYLFALVAGDFDVLNDKFITKSGKEVTLQIFVDKGNLDKADYAMQSLKASMKWDETRFALEYDLDIYMIVAVDFFNMGAMENKGLNVFNSKFVLAKKDTATDTDYQNIEAVIGHEYFHNWTGNRITCRDWFQLSLKEGLTVFRDQEFSADMGNRALKRINDVRLLRTVQFPEDAGPMAHPIRPDKVLEMNNFYTVTVYEKGAEIIRMLHTLLGEKIFQAGMQIYIQRHDGQAVTCVDFLNAMQQALVEAGSQLDLTQFELWYSQAGTPLVTITDDFDAVSGTYEVTITQEIPDTPNQTDKKPMMIPLGIDFYDQSGQKHQVTPCEQTQEFFDQVQGVLILTQKTQVFKFKKLSEKPIASFLRDFSAPIKLNYAYEKESLLTLMTKASNAFVRWDAGQQILVEIIKEGIRKTTEGEHWILSTELIDIYRGVLLDKAIDVGLVTELLTLPTVTEVVQWFDLADPVVIDKVLYSLSCQLGYALRDEFFACFYRYKLSSYHIDAKEAAQRGFVNLCLKYLALGTTLSSESRKHLDDSLALNETGTLANETSEITPPVLGSCDIEKMVLTHFNSDNMTDKIASLNIAIQADLSCQKICLDEYENRYQQDNLAMDKWLTAQALTRSSSALINVQKLMDHSAFTIQNPNRVRALIGSFVMHNHKVFHKDDGSGYQFLSDVLKVLNQSNPQVASRLIEPLLHYKRYIPKYAVLMRKIIEELSELDNLSNDLKEKISNALDD